MICHFVNEEMVSLWKQPGSPCTVKSQVLTWVLGQGEVIR